VAVWYAFGVFEMVYVKRVVDSVPMTSWSRTYYQARPPCVAADAALARPPLANATLPRLSPWAGDYWRRRWRQHTCMTMRLSQCVLMRPVDCVHC
jgi:hypothetical protein